MTATLECLHGVLFVDFPARIIDFVSHLAAGRIDFVRHFAAVRSDFAAEN